MKKGTSVVTTVAWLLFALCVARRSAASVEFRFTSSLVQNEEQQQTLDDSFLSETEIEDLFAQHAHVLTHDNAPIPEPPLTACDEELHELIDDFMNHLEGNPLPSFLCLFAQYA